MPSLRHFLRQALNLPKSSTRSLLASAAVAATTAVYLAGCTVGPNYKRPAAVTPAKWDVAEPWRQSAPRDAFPKGEWWAVFNDNDLNALEKQALAENQNIKVSLARLDQAKATAAIQIATLFPTLGTAPSIERQRLSG